MDFLKAISSERTTTTSSSSAVVAGMNPLQGMEVTGTSVSVTGNEERFTSKGNAPPQKAMKRKKIDLGNSFFFLFLVLIGYFISINNYLFSFAL